MGATYFLTQPIYSRQKIDEILEAVRDVASPIFLGIMPLASLRNAEVLHNEVPGINIPEAVRDRLRDAGDDWPGAAIRTAVARRLARTGHARDAAAMLPATSGETEPTEHLDVLAALLDDDAVQDAVALARSLVSASFRAVALVSLALNSCDKSSE